MTENWLLKAEDICFTCGGHCCDGAHPPISENCYQRLLGEGVKKSAFEQNGYRYIRSHDDGTCMLSKGGKCTIHGIKPETCRAGPFTFDVKGDVIEIFLKFESICPIVRLLKETPEAYNQQYIQAVQNITWLVAHLTEEELAVICRIDEPETEKVAEIPRVYLKPHDHRH
ncbi:YkgJ family cysteine cluster protein [Methanoregula sp.]|uniref:YkgJ family cysteine cluster protein n=1 Tax=Methanoregula sp. TaxID=2052170 RepID=UPI0023754269|nr:YkgJ family cysteine cluster protein [Methanoregula sp.]MDD1686915.1 YkgJ family cysteine cluster protein [Methanoregula sp.]